MKPMLCQIDSWSVEVQTLNNEPGEFEYFGYIMTKHEAILE